MRGILSEEEDQINLQKIRNQVPQCYLDDQAAKEEQRSANRVAELQEKIAHNADISAENLGESTDAFIASGGPPWCPATREQRDAAAERNRARAYLRTVDHTHKMPYDDDLLHMVAATI